MYQLGSYCYSCIKKKILNGGINSQLQNSEEQKMVIQAMRSSSCFEGYIPDTVYVAETDFTQNLKGKQILYV